MVDGTGMCGACRIEVSGETKSNGHRLSPPFCSKASPICMRIKRPTLIDTHNKFEISFDSEIAQNKRKLIAGIFCEDPTENSEDPKISQFRI